MLRASRSENDDLFWALRGGGGNFGVVTEFVLKLHEVGPKVTAGIIAWPGSDAEGVLNVFRNVAESSPRELTAVVLRRNAPPAPWLPEDVHGKPIIAIVVCHSGDLEQAQADLAPIKSHGEPLADLIQVKDYTAQQSMLDATQPKGMNYYWKSEFVSGLSDELFATFNAQFEDLKAPANQMVLFQVGGALNEHPEDDGAMGNRDAAFACVIQALWTPDSDAGEANQAWVRNAWQQIKPYSTGGNYINFQTSDETDERTPRVISRELPAPRDDQGQVRPNKPLPSEPKYPPLGTSVSAEVITGLLLIAVPIAFNVGRVPRRWRRAFDYPNILRKSEPDEMNLQSASASRQAGSRVLLCAIGTHSLLSAARHACHSIALTFAVVLSCAPCTDGGCDRQWTQPLPWCQTTWPGALSTFAVPRTAGYASPLRSLPTGSTLSPPDARSS